jgi:hypothetical protein
LQWVVIHVWIAAYCPRPRRVAHLAHTPSNRLTLIFAACPYLSIASIAASMVQSWRLA